MAGSQLRPGDVQALVGGRGIAVHGRVVLRGYVHDDELHDRLAGERGAIRNEVGDAVRVVVTAAKTSPVETWPQGQGSSRAITPDQVASGTCGGRHLMLSHDQSRARGGPGFGGD